MYRVTFGVKYSEMMKSNNPENPDGSWCYAFEKAGRAYIDPIMKNRFNVEYYAIGPESGIKCLSKNIRFNIDFYIPHLPQLSISDGRGMHSKWIKSKEISPKLERIEKEFKKGTAGSLTRWMRECIEGKYDHYIDESVKTIADYLKKEIKILKITDKPERPWWFAFEKAVQSYIDPILDERFHTSWNIPFGEINRISTSENFCFYVKMAIPSFLTLHTANGRDKRFRRIKSREISPKFQQIEKEYIKEPAVTFQKKYDPVLSSYITSHRSFSKWMRECHEGKFDDYIDEGIKMIADYLKEIIER